MKILVTGGAGFIASHISERYLRDGHDVAILDNLSSGFRENIPASVQFYHGSICDSAFLRKTFEDFKPEVVNHHAAQIDVRKSVEDPASDAETNIIGSIRLIQEAVRSGVKRFVYGSTGGVVYGEPPSLPASENHPVHPECAYGISKHTVEHYLELYRILERLPYVVLRYSNVYGPRQNPHGEAGVNAIFIGLMLEGKTPTIFGDGNQLRDYVYVSDVVEANVRALTRGEGQIFNIGSGIGTSVKVIYDTLADLLSSTSPPHFAPARKGELDKIYLDSRKAQEILGWEMQVSFRDGLQKTIEWFESKHEMKSV